MYAMQVVKSIGLVFVLALILVATSVFAVQHGAVVPTSHSPHPRYQQPPSINLVGGPDTYGYRYIDNQEEDGPTFNWIEPSVGATDLTPLLNYDMYAGPIAFPAGFSFPFYGTNYTEVYISQSGNLTFGSGYWNWQGGPFAGGPAGIYFATGDCIFFNGGIVKMELLSNPNRLLIYVYHISYFEAQNGFNDYEFELYPDGAIKMQCNLFNSLSSWGEPFSCGIQSANAASSCFYPSPFDNMVASRAILWYTLGQVSDPTPDNLATNVPTNVTLNWNAARAAAGYDVLLGISNPPPLSPVSSNQVGTSYSFSSLPNTTYYWQIVPRNTTGTNTGPIWSFTTGSAAAPNAPSDGYVSNPTTTSLTMNWTDNSSDETGFLITRSTDGNLFAPLTTVGASVTTYTDDSPSLTLNTHYWYRVYAQGSGGTSSGFAAANYWTLVNPPAAPTVVSTGITTVTIAIHGRTGNPDSTKYAIHETTTNRFVQTNGMLGSSPVWQTVSSWSARTQVNGLTVNTSYSFEVKARNGGGTETAYSSPVTFSTAASYSLPFYQDFGPTFSATDWPTQWGTSVFGNGGTNGSQLLRMYGQLPGGVTVMWSPPTNTVGVAGALLNYDFWVSSAQTFGELDTLMIVYSLNGGVSYTPISVRYSDGIGANNLITTAISQNEYDVCEIGWMTDTVALPVACIGQTSVMIGWRAVRSANDTPPPWVETCLGVDNITIRSGNPVSIVAFNPPNLSFDGIRVNTTANRTVYLKNNGTGVLHVSNIASTTVVPTPNTFTVAAGDSVVVNVSWTPMTVATLVDTIVCTSDASNGNANTICITGYSCEASGGPDAFGYRYKTSEVPGGPTFNWVSTLPDDREWPHEPQIWYNRAVDGDFWGCALNSGFPWYGGPFLFPFYGDTFTTVNISADGFLGLNSTPPCNGNYPTTGYNLIAPVSGDNFHDPYSRTAYLTFGTSPTGYFVCEFDYEYYNGHVGDGNYAKTYEVILYEDGTILFQYRWTGTNSPQYPFVGIDDAGSNAGFNLNRLIQPNMSDFAIQFYQLDLPTAPSPQDSATGAPQNTTLNWANCNHSTGYDVFFDTVNPPVAQVVADQTDTSWIPPSNLSANTTYYWRVQSRSHSVSESSPVWSFTTGTTPTTPQVSISYNPATSNTTLTWAQPSGTIDGYKVYRNSTTGYFIPTFAQLLTTVIGATTTQYIDIGTTGQEYYIVTSYNTGSSTSSIVSSPNPVKSGGNDRSFEKVNATPKKSSSANQGDSRRK